MTNHNHHCADEKTGFPITPQDVESSTLIFNIATTYSKDTILQSSTTSLNIKKNLYLSVMIGQSAKILNTFLNPLLDVVKHHTETYKYISQQFSQY